MPEDRGLRYDTAIATFVAVLAVAVAAYTAYIQRQQVRAQGDPILEFTTGNAPKIGFWIANKGSGPALVRHVVVTVDGTPVPDWGTMLKTLLGPGRYSFSVDSFGGIALTPGERVDVFALNVAEGDPLFVKLNKDRFRVGAEVC